MGKPTPSDPELSVSSQKRTVSGSIDGRRFYTLAFDSRPRLPLHPDEIYGKTSPTKSLVSDKCQT